MLEKIRAVDTCADTSIPCEFYHEKLFQVDFLFSFKRRSKQSLDSGRTFYQLVGHLNKKTLNDTFRFFFFSSGLSGSRQWASTYINLNICL